jgi:hypothetical protein
VNEDHGQKHALKYNLVIEIDFALDKLYEIPYVLEKVGLNQVDFDNLHENLEVKYLLKYRCFYQNKNTMYPYHPNIVDPNEDLAYHYNVAGAPPLIHFGNNLSLLGLGTVTASNKLSDKEYSAIELSLNWTV